MALSAALAIAVLAPAEALDASAGSRPCRPIEATTTTDLGTLGGGETYGTDIDDRGRVVGRSETPSDLLHAFRWVRGEMTDLTPSLPGPSSAIAANERGQVLLERSDPATGTPAALWSRGRTIDISDGYPLDLNKRGQVLLNPSALWHRGTIRPIEAPAGSGLTAIALGLGDGGHVFGSLLPVPGEGGGHPDPAGWFVWRHGTLAQIDVTPYRVREVVDIDPDGRTLVNASDMSGGSRALLWDDGGYVDLGSLTPGGNTWATDMNDRGQIVGASATASGDHAFLWQDGEMTDIHTLGDGHSHAIAIGARGHVIGALTPTAGRGFLWWCGEMLDLMTPGVYVNQPIDVNARGQVISAIDSLSGSRVVLSTPARR